MHFYHINFTVEDLEFVTKLHNYSLFGEVNLLRYISRVLYNFDNCLDPVQANILDTVLDYCYCLQIEKSSKKQQSILQLITKKLGTKKWFGINEPNIVDIAVWSVIKQISVQNLPSNLQKWFNTCEKDFK